MNLFSSFFWLGNWENVNGERNWKSGIIWLPRKVHGKERGVNWSSQLFPSCTQFFKIHCGMIIFLCHRILQIGEDQLVCMNVVKAILGSWFISICSSSFLTAMSWTWCQVQNLLLVLKNSKMRNVTYFFISSRDCQYLFEV